MGEMRIQSRTASRATTRPMERQGRIVTIRPMNNKKDSSSSSKKRDYDGRGEIAKNAVRDSGAEGTITRNKRIDTDHDRVGMSPTDDYAQYLEQENEEQLDRKNPYGH